VPPPAPSPTFLTAQVRITGGALLVAAEEVVPPNIGLYTAAYILESAGLSPLLLATIGFLGLVYGSSSYVVPDRLI